MTDFDNFFTTERERFDTELVLQTVERKFPSIPTKILKGLRELVAEYYDQHINVETEPRVLVAVLLIYYQSHRKIHISQKTICQHLGVYLPRIRAKKHLYLDRLGLVSFKWTMLLSASLSGRSL